MQYICLRVVRDVVDEFNGAKITVEVNGSNLKG